MIPSIITTEINQFSGWCGDFSKLNLRSNHHYFKAPPFRDHFFYIYCACWCQIHTCPETARKPRNKNNLRIKKVFPIWKKLRASSSYVTVGWAIKYQGFFFVFLLWRSGTKRSLVMSVVCFLWKDWKGETGGKIEKHPRRKKKKINAENWYQRNILIVYLFNGKRKRKTEVGILK